MAEDLKHKCTDCENDGEFECRDCGELLCDNCCVSTAPPNPPVEYTICSSCYNGWQERIAHHYWVENMTPKEKEEYNKREEVKKTIYKIINDKNSK